MPVRYRKSFFKGMNMGVTLKAVINFILISVTILFFVTEYALSSAAEEQVDIDVTTKISIDLPTTTQGPLWPPAALSDENGDFIVVGIGLIKDENNKVKLRTDQAMIVSKNTVPPLDENGVETFINPFAVPYKVNRYLDLTKDSPDLDIVLYSNSFGPPEGSFGGGPRVPAASVSAYNLNSFPLNGQPCPDIFPSESQRFTYTRPSFALHQVPVPGYQGDQLAYESDTGAEFTPSRKTGSSCPPQGCEGENKVDFRRKSPITLGEWLKAKVSVDIELMDYSVELEAYTAASFTIKAKNLLPNSIYHVFALRTNLLIPNPIPAVADPLGLPSIIVTDEHGRGRLLVVHSNPFPEPALDDAGLRIIGISVAFRSGFQNNGACVTAYGPGVDVHAVASSFASGVFDFTNFITRADR